MKRQNTKDRQGTILSVALKLFTERGYFNTSVHDIQKQAKVSIGSIYHHFGNKEAIAKAIFTHIESSMNDVISAIMATHSTATISTTSWTDAYRSTHTTYGRRS